MAKYSPVMPNRLLREVLGKAPEVVGDYLLCIASDVIRDATLWADVREDSDRYIIMDNGTIELGYPLDVATLNHALEISGADCIALPDYLDEGDNTIRATQIAAQRWARQLPPSVEFMVIPQGKRSSEYELCAIHQAAIPEIRNHRACWGIPKKAVHNVGTRTNLVEICHALQKDWPIHLLGFSNDFSDDLICAGFEGVQGIDSAVPIRLAQEGVEADIFTINAHGSRDDFWEVYARADAPPADIDLIRRNVEFVRRCVSCPKGE